MGFIRIGNFDLLSWGGGNDRYTRTPSGYRIDPNFGYNKRSEKWEVISGRERMLYETTGALNIVVGRFAEMVANGRFVHKRMNGTQEGEIIQDSELVNLLENPNPLQGGEEWLTELVVSYFVLGNSVMLPVYALKSDPVPYVINNLPWENLTLETTGKRWDQRKVDGIIKEYRLKYNSGSDDVYKASEVIHLRRPGGKSSLIGESILNALHMEISNIRGAMGFRNVHINEHGALGLLVNKAGGSEMGHIPLKEEEKLKLEKQYTNKTHGIHEGQSRVKFVDGNLDYIHTNYPIKESMLFEEVSEDMKKIIDMINLNDNIFSKEKSKIQANLAEGLKMAYQDAIFPFSGRLCQKLKLGLKMNPNEWLELDYSHLPIFKEDEKEKAQTAKTKADALSSLIDSGIDAKEARIIVGL